MEVSPRQGNSDLWQDLGADLVFTQDDSGKYLSFYWQDAVDYGLSDEKIVGSFLEDTFTSVSILEYNHIIKQVLERHIPKRRYCYFKYLNQFFPFELVISPILPPGGKATRVLVMGHRLGKTEISLPHKFRIPVNIYSYAKLLVKITKKVSKTLNLATIWQQTVKSIGEALVVSRCNILSYDETKKQLQVRAEYSPPLYKSLVGYKLDVESEDYFQQAMSSQSVVIKDRVALNDPFEQKSLLLVSTFYQQKRNGLIWIQQCDRYRQWTEAEIELVQELADRVGTAIAHATLYQELELARNEAESANRLKSNFLASTTHELRTPLNGIIGFLQLVLNDMADDPQEEKEFLQEAHNSALYLLNLINDILDFAKIEAGKMDLELVPVDLRELFQDVETKTRPQAQEKNLSLKIQLPPIYDPIMVYGNHRRLLQVMLNLVGNAIKFTHEGGVTISAEVVQKKIQHHDRQFPGIVKINVADTGIGVPLDQQKNLFDNFFQVDGGSTREYGGTGLGLAISQRLVEAMGGKIDFYSMGEGLGSTVSLSIPLNHAPVMKSLAQAVTSS